MTEQIREDWGQKYIFKRYEFQTGVVERWESLNENGGNKVSLKPLLQPPGAWILEISSEKSIPFHGEDAEKRAFCCADGFIRQDTSISKPNQE